MTTAEAQRILSNIACRCDGMGTVPSPNGRETVKCPDCDGEYISQSQVDEAQEIIRGDWADPL